MSEQIDKLRTEMVAWAKRPPARSPAMARSSVERLIRKDRWMGWRTAAAAAAVVALTVTALVSVPALRPHRDPDDVTSVASPAADGSLLVYELRSGAKLYLTLSDKSTNGEDNGK